MFGSFRKGLKRKSDSSKNVTEILDCNDKSNFWNKNTYELNELILQHFDFKDVLKASEVSTVWYKMIAMSGTSMKKIQINLGKNSSNDFDLLTSSRKYTNLKLHRVSESTLEWLSKFTWHKISMLIGSLSDVQCTEILRLFAPTVNEFEFYIDSISSSRDIAAIDFPNLEKITFRWTSHKIFEPFFGTNNHNLKNVVIELNKEDQSNAVKKFLIQNRNITQLSMRLSNKDYNSLFSEDFTTMLQCKMTQLSFYWRHTNYVEPEKIKNLKKIFLSQKDCLKRLVFECTFDCKSILELVINEMQSLEHLTFVDLDDTTLLLSKKKNFDIKPNPTINQIDVCVNWFISSELFKQIILASPNLEVLYVFELSVETLQFIARNAKKLRHLVYEEIDEECDYSKIIMNDAQTNHFIEINWDQDFEFLYPELHEKMQFH